MILLILVFRPESVRASEWTDAAEFFSTYGSDAVFHPVSEDDGYIYYGTMGNKTNAGIRYKLAGWKAVLKNQKGQVLQTLYFQLGGNYLELLQEKTVNGYAYCLYRMSLGSLKSRLNAETMKQLQEGKCSLTLDACMTVVRNGTAQGTITDQGQTSGLICTTYEEIKDAAKWSSKGLESLKKYFGKKVQGLFFSVTLTCGEGISSVSGAGTYCYGTEADIAAVCNKDAEFAGWTGSISRKENNIRISISQNLTLKANANVNHPPELYAGPVYISRAEISEGNIDSEWICSCFLAEDREDGELQIQLKDFDETLLTRSQDEDSFQITVKARDSKGIEVSKEVMIYIMKTGIKSGMELTGRIRFISMDYFEDEDGNKIPSAQGGLMEGSVWTADESYRELLRKILND